LLLDVISSALAPFAHRYNGAAPPNVTAPIAPVSHNERFADSYEQMRLGVAWEPNANAYYRAVYPLKMMELRGHEVVWPRDDSGEDQLARLAGCDVVHVYRTAHDTALSVMADLVQGGTPLVYDNDDDFTAVPKESSLYRSTGGFKGQRIFANTVKAARLAYAFTTPSEVLGGKYRRAGVERVEVIENSVLTTYPRRRHNGKDVVIGWVAGAEHRADANRLRIPDVLRRLIAAHDDVRVECIGVDLGLRERYENIRHVPFFELPGRIGGFDVGIAPLSDIGYNRTRSNIKLKEYAASGVPWLASPIGPYVGLGEEQGGRLVAEDRWLEELQRLVVNPRERERLARNAERWAKEQTIEAAADRWETLFCAAAGRDFTPRTARRQGPLMRLRGRLGSRTIDR
jgi:glycosyltransferase involved in cell wall biosynthesis